MSARASRGLAPSVLRVFSDFLRGQADEVAEAERLALVRGQVSMAANMASCRWSRETQRWGWSCWRPAGCPGRPLRSCRRGSRPRGRRPLLAFEVAAVASMISARKPGTASAAVHSARGALSSDRIASRQASCRMSSASSFLARWAPMRACRNPSSAGRLASTNSARADSSPDRSRRVIAYHGWRRRTSGDSCFEIQLAAELGSAPRRERRG